MIETIKTKIITLIQSISDIQFVYGFNKSTIEGYPYVIVTRSTSTVEPADYSAVTKRLKRTYVFNIDLFIEMNEATFGTERSEEIAMGIIDQILEKFDTDITLTGSLLYSTLTLEDTPRYVQNGNLENVASFTFEGYTLINSL